MNQITAFGLKIGVIGFIMASCAYMDADSIPSLKRSDSALVNMMKGEAEGNRESNRIKRECVGIWQYDHNVAKAKVEYRFKKINIAQNGNIAIEYETASSGKAIVLEGKILLIHKATNDRPGKRPTIIVKHQVGSDDEFIPLVDVTVDYDNRVPKSKGQVLKFVDLNGNTFVFLREK